MNGQAHVPVLPEESLQALNIKPDGIYIDCTFGRGGHSQIFLNKISEQGRLFVLDQDLTAIQTATEKYRHDARVEIIHSSFEHLLQIGETYDLLNKTDGIFFDLGVSSPQLDDAQRGFSFSHDGPLDMRMNNTVGQTASEWLASCSLQQLTAVLREFGEERHAKKIATSIMQAQQQTSLNSTLQLATIIKQCYPRHYQGIHPATRSFQALRIAVNGELEALKIALSAAYRLIKMTGRLAVISFHSLEDRIVKRFIRNSRPLESLAKLPIQHQAAEYLAPIGKLIRPGEMEMEHNPRSRSARLRIAEKVFK